MEAQQWRQATQRQPTESVGGAQAWGELELAVLDLTFSLPPEGTRSGRRSTSPERGETTQEVDRSRGGLGYGRFTPPRRTSREENFLTQACVTNELVGRNATALQKCLPSVMCSRRCRPRGLGKVPPAL